MLFKFFMVFADTFFDSLSESCFVFLFITALRQYDVNITAINVASTTGDLPKIVVTQSGKLASAADACETPTPIAAARPTIEEFR